MDVPKQLQDKLAQFQNLQNQMQMLALQKQQLMLQKVDLENAKKELEDLNEGKIYRMIGPLLVETTKKDGMKYVTDEGESSTAKLAVIEKQEKKLVERMNEMRNELNSMMQPPKAG